MLHQKLLPAHFEDSIAAKRALPELITFSLARRRRLIVAPAAVGRKGSLARARGPKCVGCIALLAGLPILAPRFIDGFPHENKDPTDRCEVT